MTLKTPAGTPTWSPSAAIAKADRGVASAGFKTMRQELKSGVRDAYRRVEHWETVRKAINDADALNLDRKQVVLDFFFALRAA